MNIFGVIQCQVIGNRGRSIRGKIRKCARPVTANSAVRGAFTRDLEVIQRLASEGILAVGDGKEAG